MDKIKHKDIIKAHQDSANHRASVLTSKYCGCFYCLKIFTPSEITDWIDEKKEDTNIIETGQTALCPYCGIDSVIGSASGYPIHQDFLKQMNDYWFQRAVTIGYGTHKGRGKKRRAP